MKGVSATDTNMILRAYAKGEDLRKIADEFGIDSGRLHKLLIEVVGPGMQRLRAREIVRTGGVADPLFVPPVVPVRSVPVRKTPPAAAPKPLTARQVELGRDVRAGVVTHDDPAIEVIDEEHTHPVDRLIEFVERGQAAQRAVGPIPAADWPQPDDQAVTPPRPPLACDHNPPRELVDAYMADVLLRHSSHRVPKLATRRRAAPAADVEPAWTWPFTDGVILAEYGAYQCAPCHYTGPAGGHTARATCPQLRPVRVVILAEATK